METVTLPFPTNPRADCYTHKYPVRGMHGGQSALQGNTRALRRAFPDWTRADHDKAGEYHRKQAQTLKELWTSIANCAARITWGRDYVLTDYRISGVASLEFPKELQDALRYCAHTSGEHNSVAWTHYNTRAKVRA